MRYISCFITLIFFTLSCGSSKDKDKNNDAAPVAAQLQPTTPTPTVTPTPTPTSTPEPVPEPAPAFTEVFTTVLKPKCLRCHNSNSASGGINLETKEILLTTEDLVRCGHADDSLLYQVVKKDEMPFRGPPLPLAEKQLLQRWIDGNCL
ncbi:MAG: hypothetical protein M3Q07_16955 [Pseudobdellovibrionaceae bacterium]|nr:hypothetical protein [Pseudobdellovibrionaceae bacterium]